MMRRIIFSVVLLSLSLAGCDDDPYDVVYLGDLGGPDMLKPDATCAQRSKIKGPEICDSLDNDHDCFADEDFDFQNDSRHCGKCNYSCALFEAITACTSATCRFKGCNANYWDLNKDLAKGWSEKSDGCEYPCVYTGQEKCDDKDNDCDGKKDEDFNLQNDVKNCSKCGNACQLANAVPKCDKGVCGIQSCLSGFIDKDGKVANGCEEVCVKSNGGVEICDGKDNDCNKVTDDVKTPGTKIDHTSDPEHCGGCNIACLFPNAYALCKSSKCGFNGCKSGWQNADKDASNGCECKYEGALDSCDGKDNDCDGNVDKTSAGKPLTLTCYTGPSGTLNKGNCKAGSQSCNNGVWGTCQGEVKPLKEYCDAKDTDCDGANDAKACVFAKTGRESRLDEPNISFSGSANSTQLAVAGKGDRILAVWVDRRKKQSDIYANFSTNGGKTWKTTADIAVATESNNKLEPQVAFGGPQGSSLRAYVVYEKFVVKDPYSTTPGLRNVYLRRSLNGGQTWGSPVSIKSGSNKYDALYVRMAVLPAPYSGQQDRVIICWEQISVDGAVNPNIYCRLSLTSGSSFKSAVKVNNTANNAILPRIAADNNYVYVTWQQGQNIMVDRAPVPSSSSTNLSFGLDTQLDNGAGQEPRIHADGTGRVIVVWEDLRDSLVNIRANRSINWGSTWLTTDVRLDLDPGNVNGDSTSPAIAARAGGKIFVAWEDTSRGKRDIYVNSSSDGGKTWGKLAARVPTNTAGSVTSRKPFVAVEPSGKNVYVAWDDLRNGTYRDIYFSPSLDDGVTWNIPDYRINEASAGKADARAAKIWVAPSRVAVLWLDNRQKIGSKTTTGSNTDIYCSYVE